MQPSQYLCERGGRMTTAIGGRSCWHGHVIQSAEPSALNLHDHQQFCGSGGTAASRGPVV